MKKNEKGFFLAETIIMIALVTTIMAYVYPNISKIYDNYNSRTNYYDQTEDIYKLKAFYACIKNKSFVFDSDIQENDMKEIDGYNIDCKIDDITTVYYSKYLADLSSNNDYNFNKYLKRIRKTTNDSYSYRLIGIFSKGSSKDSKTTYASIRIDPPTFTEGE